MSGDEEWTDEDLVEVFGDDDDEEVRAARARIAVKAELARQANTPGYRAYQERVEAEGQMRLLS